MEYSTYLPYLMYYFEISIASILLINVLAGFFDEPPNAVKNIIDGIFWPITLALILGTTLRVLKENFNTKDKK
jgi:hypothetical protein